MGSYAVLDRLDFDGKTYIPGGKPVTIDDADLIGQLQALKVIGRDPLDQDGDSDHEPARIRIATAPWLGPVEVGGLTFSPEFRPIEAGEIDEGQLLAMVEHPSLRIEGLRVGADPVTGWEIWDDERRALTIEGLRDHIEYDLEHGRAHDRVGPPSVRANAEPAATVEPPSAPVVEQGTAETTPPATSVPETVSEAASTSVVEAAVGFDVAIAAATESTAAPDAAITAAAPARPAPKPKPAPKAKAAAKADAAEAK